MSDTPRDFRAARELARGMIDRKMRVREEIEAKLRAIDEEIAAIRRFEELADREGGVGDGAANAGATVTPSATRSAGTAPPETTREAFRERATMTYKQAARLAIEEKGKPLSLAEIVDWAQSQKINPNISRKSMRGTMYNILKNSPEFFRPQSSEPLWDFLGKKETTIKRPSLE